MAIPDKIKIKRIADYHTHFIGEYDDEKQFLGYEHFIFDKSSQETDWQKARHEYVVLYLFNEKGDLISFKHWYAGTTANLNCDTTQKLKEMVNELGKVRFCNIKVKPFNLKIDNHTFGLIPFENSDYERVELHPSNAIAFSYPWNGEYDT